MRTRAPCGASPRRSRRAGVTDVCISPGSRDGGRARARSRPAGASLRHRRRASDRLLRSRAGARERRPVVLLCTSGTAAANYLPAIVEASLARVPLIVADRRSAAGASRLRRAADDRSGRACSPATCAGASTCRRRPRASIWIVSTARSRVARSRRRWSGRRGPVHLNLPMREPLLDVEEEVTTSPRSGRAAEARPFTTVHAARAVTAPQTLERVGADARGTRARADRRRPRHRRWRRPVRSRSSRALSAGRFSPTRSRGFASARTIAPRSPIATTCLLRDREFAAAHAPDAILQIGSLPASKPLARFLGEAPPRLPCRGGAAAAAGPIRFTARPTSCAPMRRSSVRRSPRGSPARPSTLPGSTIGSRAPRRCEPRSTTSSRPTTRCSRESSSRCLATRLPAGSARAARQQHAGA